MRKEKGVIVILNYWQWHNPHTAKPTDIGLHLSDNMAHCQHCQSSWRDIYSLFIRKFVYLNSIRINWISNNRHVLAYYSSQHDIEIFKCIKQFFVWRPMLTWNGCSFTTDYITITESNIGWFCKAFMLLSHICEYACKYSEYESLKFAVNSTKNCEQIANIFTSVIPRSLLTNILQMHCECLPTLANALRLAYSRCEWFNWA